MLKALAAFALVASLPVAAAALPAAPVRPAPPGLLAGRWYEIARSANPVEGRDCQGVFNDFAGAAGGDLVMTQTCHVGAPSGPPRTARGHVRLLPGGAGAKMQISYFGGLVSHEYWIVDFDPAAGWAIMATPKAKYMWLLARRPGLDEPVRAAALRRMAELGYDLRRLSFTPQVAR